MRISRRDFLKYCSISAGALGLSASGLLKLQQVLAKEGNAPVIWLQGANCTGCSTSLLNSVYYTTVEGLLLLDSDGIDLQYHTTVMAAAGDLAVSAAEVLYGATNFVLVVEGSVQTAKVSANLPGGGAGKYCEIGDLTGDGNETLMHAVESYATPATAILAVGTCAAFGGIPAARGAVTGATGVYNFLKNVSTDPNAKTNANKVVNIPGCPPHPDWIVGSIATLLKAGEIDLDKNRRPRDFYTRYVCNGNMDVKCPWIVNAAGGNGKGLAKVKWEPDPTAGNSKYEGCLGVLGCRGRKTKADCAYRKWNTGTALTPGVNWCVGSRGMCQGCTDPAFPTSKKFYTFL